MARREKYFREKYDFDIQNGEPIRDRLQGEPERNLNLEKSVNGDYIDKPLSKYPK